MEKLKKDAVILDNMDNVSSKDVVQLAHFYNEMYAASFLHIYINYFYQTKSIVQQES